MEAIDQRPGSSSDHVAVDVHGLATKLEYLMSDPLFMATESCIFRVPTILARHNEKAYKPNAFSVGPIHYMKGDLMKATQKIKLRYLRGLISRSRSCPQTRLRDFIKAITEVQKVARQCYAGEIGMGMNEFVQVMVLDGCFIIELFRKKAYKDLREKDDPIFEMSCLLQFLYHDLIMLENQIPWVVLDTLFDLTRTTITDQKPLVLLATEFFGTVFSRTPPLTPPPQSKHILDMFRNSLLLSSSSLKTSEQDWQPVPSVTRLTEAGIKFKKGEPSKSILDIKFEKGVLEIPSLLIQETTEPLLRNLISLEQCCPGYEPRITSYAVLMDNLINTNADIEILTRAGVLENWLSVEEATKFFNELYTDTYVKVNYCLQLSKDVDKYCKRHWPRYRRVLMHDYFKHPWSAISLGVAAFVLTCTFLQTLFTIIK